MYKCTDYLLEEIINHPHSHKEDHENVADVFRNNIHTKITDSSGNLPHHPGKYDSPP